MGKRKSRTVVKSAAAPKVMKTFDCPYCSHDSSVEVKMERTKGIGTLSCRICSVSYQKRLGSLTKEVDIYCEWIDCAEELNCPQQSKKKSETGLGFEGDQAQPRKIRQHSQMLRVAAVDSDDDEAISNVLEEEEMTPLPPKKVRKEMPREEVKIEEKALPAKGGGLGQSLMEAPVKRTVVTSKVIADDNSDSDEDDSEVAELF